MIFNCCKYKTEEVVNTDSIYLITDDGEYHRATENGLNEKNITGAYLNTDFERKSIAGDNSTTYFFHIMNLQAINL